MRASGSLVILIAPAILCLRTMAAQGESEVVCGVSSYLLGGSSSLYQTSLF